MRESTAVVAHLCGLAQPQFGYAFEMLYEARGYADGRKTNLKHYPERN